MTVTVVGVSCGCVARAVHRLPRQRRPRSDLVPSRVDVGAPALMPPPHPARRRAPGSTRPLLATHAGPPRPQICPPCVEHGRPAPRGCSPTLPPATQGPRRRLEATPLAASGRCLGRFAGFFSNCLPFCVLCWEPFCCCTVSSHSRGIFAHRGYRR
jgi:hypothetical protein